MKAAPPLDKCLVTASYRGSNSGPWRKPWDWAVHTGTQSVDAAATRGSGSVFRKSWRMQSRLGHIQRYAFSSQAVGISWDKFILLGLIRTNKMPTRIVDAGDIKRNNNVIITPKRRRDVVLT